jgi:plastocyanin
MQESDMNYLSRYIAMDRLIPHRIIPSRAALAAMLLGPIIGATLAFNAVAAQDTNTVSIDNFTFSPKELTVPVGTTIKWVNHDDMPHTVVENDKTFRSKTLDTNDTFSFTFTKAGAFSYFCSLHPHMIGKITVQ